MRECVPRGPGEQYFYEKATDLRVNWQHKRKLYKLDARDEQTRE